MEKEKIENLLKPMKEKMDKHETIEKKTVAKKQEENFEWKPFAKELGVIIVKGFITGLSLRAGGYIFDYSITRGMEKSTFTVLKGGKDSISA